MMLLTYFLFSLSSYNVICGLVEYCNFRTCGQCIGSSEKCVWCAMEKPMDRRCVPYIETNITTSWCDMNFIINPQPNNTVIIDKGFNETIADIAVQMRPQHIKINTRPGFVNHFTIYFHPAKDYPLDVYYLIDISHTMRKKKEDLRDQANAIYKQLTSYTNNVRLGVGSFVEKPGFPYVNKHKTLYPHISHAFKNHLSLTKNVTRFIFEVESMDFRGNYDDPESGLDALMQVMTCQKELGWRAGARRIIVLCTDSTYHSAGDGKIVGAIKPNDMQCHLENNFYNDTIALTYDYPSVSQMDKVARDLQFKIVFATDPVVSTEYEKLAAHITEAKYAALNTKTDALKIIKEAYLDYATKAQVSFEVPEFIQLTVDQDCLSKPTKNCESTPLHRTLKIDGKLIVRNCPSDKDIKHDVIIKIVGIEDETRIELDIDCQCDCERTTGTVVNDTCNNNGFIQCGICKCNPGSYGDECYCNGTSNELALFQKCRFNSDDKMLCSGKGVCRCGKCECQNGFSGNFCQFDDTACPRNNEALCSDHGNCHHGICHCNLHWIGDDCGCILDNTTCIIPYSKELCSGNGKCICGKCECDEPIGENETYTGNYCDYAQKRCKELEEYVLCNFINNKTMCDHQYKANDTLLVFMNFTELNRADWQMFVSCKKQIENGSYIIFKYRYEDAHIVLGIQNFVEVPPEANIIVALGSAIGVVFLIGVITLVIWKILVDLYDKREYERFIAQSEAAECVIFNPLFQEAQVNFLNPEYGKF